MSTQQMAFLFFLNHDMTHGQIDKFMLWGWDGIARAACQESGLPSAF
jgi:hypothetical protein